MRTGETLPDVALWSIQEVARATGTTSRTLRHYGDVGILAPSRLGANGQRFYDRAALTRLQRILMLRDLGLGIPAIADVLAGQTDDTAALRDHLRWLHAEQDRLDRQIATVERTIREREGDATMTADEMFEGFDHTQYKEEVERRWGEQAYARSDAWWRGLGEQGQAQFREVSRLLGEDWAKAAGAGLDVRSEEAQAIARRHHEWLTAAWGGTRPTAEALVGLGDMYVTDERFAAAYGGQAGATFVRDALRVYAERML